VSSTTILSPALSSTGPEPGSATTLPGRLLLVLLIGLLPLLAYAIVAAEATRHASLDWLEVEVRDAARQAALREAEVLGEADRFLRALAAAPMPAGGPGELCAALQPTLAGAPAPVAALAVHLPDAGIACVVAPPHARGAAAGFGAGHVRAALAGGTAITADPQVGLVLSHALPLRDGVVPAVLALALAPDHLPPLGLPLHREQAVRMLVDPDDGTVLAATPDHAGRAGIPIAFPRVMAALRAGGADGAVVGRDADGVRRLVGHAALPGIEAGGLPGRTALLIDLPYDPLLAEADARRNEQWLIVVALALVGAAAAWLLARRAVVRPVHALLARLPGHSPSQTQMLATLRPAAAWLRQQGDLAAVADASAEMFLRLDGSLRVIYASPATRRVLGYAPAEVVDADLAAEPGWEACQALLAALRNGALRVDPCEIIARRRDDSQARLEVRATRLGDGGFLLACRDVGAEHALRQELDEARQRLATLALADRQTGLANRRRFDEVLVQELGRARRSQEPISLVLLRLTDWPDFAGRHGSAVAEEALRRLGRILSGTLRRPGDLAARMEGDLFGVLLPTTDRIGAQRVAERLHEALVAELGAGNEPALVARVGACSVLPLGEEDTAEVLLDLAHSALREAESGRGVALVTPRPVPAVALPG
jgi:diguanylate cyclase (GGDEF)-like protein